MPRKAKTVPVAGRITLANEKKIRKLAREGKTSVCKVVGSLLVDALEKDGERS